MPYATALRSELAGLCASICDDSASPGKIMRACESLFDLLCRVSALDLRSESARNSTQLPQGKAIGPAWAARCILDFMRTRAFLRGVRDALCSRSGGHILYAGTGPFAALLVPLLSTRSFEHFSFTLLDVHTSNLAALRRLLAALDLPEGQFRLEEADATQYQSETPIDILILELVQAGLATEPQVAALLQLGPQLSADGLVLPQKIRVEAALLHSRNAHERRMGQEPDGPVLHPLGTLLELEAQTIAAYAKGFPEQIFKLPATLAPEFNQLVLTTDIQVREEEWLRYADSGLTEAVPVARFEAGARPEMVAFQYRTGETPGFFYQDRGAFEK